MGLPARKLSDRPELSLVAKPETGQAAAQPRRRLSVKKLCMIVPALVAGAFYGPELALNGKNHWEAADGKPLDFARRVLTWADAETARDIYVLEATKGRGDGLTMAQRYALAAQDLEGDARAESVPSGLREAYAGQAAELRAMAASK